jgi:hypothetical protein
MTLCLLQTVVSFPEFQGTPKDCPFNRSLGSPFLSIQTLHVLRNLYFITSRVSQDASSQYMFVNLTAIDILARYPELAENFLRTIKPNELGQIPTHPLERCLDLFFLNTVEYCTLVLSPEVNDELAISAAWPYLAAGGDNKLLEIFEAAHSVALSVFAIPSNTSITAKHLPSYVSNLFMVSSAQLQVDLRYVNRCPGRFFPGISRRVNFVSLSSL